MKTAVITGATSGIGLAAAKALIQKGWRVVLVGRTPQSCSAAQSELMHDIPGASIACFCGDLSKMAEVNRIADEVLSYLAKECEGSLDALINNAGCVRGGYTETQDGYETQFALNHLSGFLLTYRLMGALKKAGGVLILTGSGSHKRCRIHWDDIMRKGRYNPLTAYKQSKLAGMMFAREFNRKFADTGVKAYVIDPGLVNTGIGAKHTGSLVSAVWSLRRLAGTKPEVPARTYAYLCCEGRPDGLYIRNCKSVRYSKRADDEQSGVRLFELSENLCGIKFDNI